MIFRGSNVFITVNKEESRSNIVVTDRVFYFNRFTGKFS